MDTFTLRIEPEASAVLEYPVPLGTLMMLQVQTDVDTNAWRAFNGRVRSDFQGWRLHQVETRNLPHGARARIVTYASGGPGNSVETVAEGIVERVG